MSDTRGEPGGARRDPTSLSMQQQTSEVVEQGKEVGERVMGIAENEMHNLTEQIRGIVSAFDAASAQLEEQGQTNVAHQVDAIADGLDRICDRISSGSWRGIAEDARGWARDNPGGFLGGSVALGFALSRLMKASGGGGSSEYPSETAERAEEGVDNGPSNPIR